MLTEQQQQQYSSLTAGGGFVELPPRCQISITGKDRTKFLNNFCTANINELQTGSLAELFVLDRRGKTMTFGHVAALPDSLMIATASAAQTQSLIEHLDQYVITEDVTLTAASETTIDVFVTGQQATEKLPILNSIDQNQFVQQNIADLECQIAHIELAGFGYCVSTATENKQALTEHLESQGLQKCEVDVLHMLRTEQRTPWYGHEVDENNLPQELRRDEKAICFTKGCYLGQETVAKIDAFGNVSRFLATFKISGDSAPPIESEIRIDDKKVGVVKFVSYSPIEDAYLATGLIKCKLAEPGTQVAIDSCEAVVR